MKMYIENTLHIGTCSPFFLGKHPPSPVHASNHKDACHQFKVIPLYHWSVPAHPSSPSPFQEAFRRWNRCRGWEETRRFALWIQVRIQPFICCIHKMPEMHFCSSKLLTKCKRNLTLYQLVLKAHFPAETGSIDQNRPCCCYSLLFHHSWQIGHWPWISEPDTETAKTEVASIHHHSY